jgi:AcrR family transcriptional regulator
MVARDGAGDLSLADVADAVGIKAPSLYKRFADRAALIEAVRESVLKDLADALAAAKNRDPGRRLIVMARAYRRFAVENPLLYPLVVVSGRPPTATGQQALAPVLATLTEIVGGEHALSAARLLTAYLHGFVTMEISRSFQLGGSVDAAFAFGLEAIMRGLGLPPGTGAIRPSAGRAIRGSDRNPPAGRT